ncbi:sensor histidine kinase [Aquipuribacter hungaricus]|uniref:Oxygen sensor histidine kinase NreB n=1 Tax=Aquipuribacter hungaricus TaxID=545624 RepID=A0ABV7WM73_9MICO
MELVLVVLAAASAARYLTRHPLTGSTAWVLVAALVFAGVYLAGRAVPPTRRDAWLAAVCLVWLGLVVAAPSFGWCAVALGFAALRVLPYRAAVAVVVALVTAVSGTWLRLSDPLDPTLVVGPACLAVLAVGAYRALERHAAAQQAVLQDLHRAQDELAAAQRRQGALAERHRLSREIHDSVAQDLSSINLLLQASEQDWSLRPTAARQHVQQAATTARNGLSEVRRVVHDLGPDTPPDSSLTDVLQQLAGEVTGQSGLAVSVQTSGTVLPLPQQVATALLRTARGALANVVEHADATRAVVTVSYLDDSVSLDVRDDGRGLPPPTSRPPSRHGQGQDDRGRDDRGPYERRREERHRDGRGLGLWAIRDRIEGLGGQLVVESTPGHGTALAATLPLSPSAPGALARWPG